MVKCKACGCERHNLKEHFLGGREPSCTMTLQTYLNTYPGAPVISELFLQKLNGLREKRGDMNLTIQKLDPKDVFGVATMGDFKVTGFLEKTKYVPEIDPDYIFPSDVLKVVLLGLETNRPLLIHGPTGSGKTELVRQICARLNRPCIRVNNFADMYSSHILGNMRVKNGATYFEYGPLPFAMPRPMVFLSDEWDALNPEVGFVYQPVLERQRTTGTLGSLLLTENGNERIDSHPMFRFIATSNTCGLGDDKGHYQGTQLQNLAFISRFQLRIKLDYLKEKEEIKILKKNFPTIADPEAASLAKVAKLIREQYEGGQINIPYSTRDLLNWADIYLMIGNPQKAMEHTCTSILPFSDAKKVSEIIQRVFAA